MSIEKRIASTRAAEYSKQQLLALYKIACKVSASAVSLGFSQHTVGSEPCFTVKRYHKGLATGMIREEPFLAHDFAKATASCEQHRVALHCDTGPVSRGDDAGVVSS
jgi:hypothetical protein